ncbi:MAG: Tn3 family transposase [Burkholderiales bacterium]|nr:Tn3 family transposase [Burkholderiales bacterium]
MTSPHETAYPRLKADPTVRELDEIYTPTRRELAFINTLARRSLNRVAILMHLKLFQRLGYFTQLTDAPETIRNHIAASIRFHRPLTLADLKRFDVSGTRPHVITALRRYLDVRPLDEMGNAWLGHIADKAAESRHVIADIINVMLEELVRHRYELPAFSTLDRLAMRAREAVNDRYFGELARQLTPQAKRLIDDLLRPEEGLRYSGWQALKREPKKPTNKETREFLQHIRLLEHLVEQMPKPDIPVPKLRQMRLLARALDAGEMAELKPQKRYALAVVFIRSQFAQTLDDATDIYIRLLQNLENSARQKLLTFQQERTLRTDMLVNQLKDILVAYQLDGTPKQRVDAIGTTFISDIEVLLAECEEHLAYAGRNHLPFLVKPYAAIRAQLLNCIQIVSPRASTEDRVIERLIAALEELRTSRSELVSLATLDLDEERDFGWLSIQWRKLVLVKASGRGKAEWANRRYLELAILYEIKEQLKSGDLFVRHGERYDDYREQLVDDTTLAAEIVEYGVVTDIEIEPSKFVVDLRTEMIALTKEADEDFPGNAHAEFVDGRLILRKPATTKPSNIMQWLDREITTQMEAVSIVDVLIDAERWLDLHRLFRPLAGTESRVEDLRMRVITTLFCYGCNLGPTQTAKSIKGLSRRQISWLNLKYVSEDLLDKAIVKVINYYNKFELPGYWGTGKRASVDGTKWNLYEQNLLSEYHIRYGGYGGLGYYYVSDKLIALFSRFISCGTYEGIYILDGLMSNESDIQPDTLHGDTQSQSYPIFALAYLLGIQLMPRIRGIKDLEFFRPDRRTIYKSLNDLFSSVIDWKLIETHLPDMLRVAVSIKLGKISASTILRRLGSHNRRNKVYFAFRELGKVIRTMFLLRYISDVELRKVIHAETNKTEQFHRFAKLLFFGGEGIIAENLRHEQRKLIKYNHLVANMVILHNVVQMTRVLTQMGAEGIEITPEMLAGVKPYRLEAINRFGDYTLDFRREIAPLDFNAPIIPVKTND